ncbi:hypothetical protein D917_07009 [Trichinella nativa]|uniref:Uncharacterized protein n=1 Tax=Trichinella nativa TaxID=6335 RepID=A0A1Y3ERE6_9BILA|nr:hypothetical protein D917_07009 [Trichinella nativa]
MKVVVGDSGQVRLGRSAGNFRSSGRPGMNYLENCPNKPVPGDNRLVGVALVATCTAPYMERARVGHVGFQLVSSSDRQLQPHDNAILPGAQFVWLLLPTRHDAHNFFTLPNRSTCSTVCLPARFAPKYFFHFMQIYPFTLVFLIFIYSEIKIRTITNLDPNIITTSSLFLLRIYFHLRKYNTLPVLYTYTHGYTNRS